MDLWFLWIVTDYGDQIKEIIIPEKKPRTSKENPEPKLTEEQKERNKNKSQLRVKVENAISWCKRFGQDSVECFFWLYDYSCSYLDTMVWHVGF